MPYGLPKDIDTPENNAKMERCVADVQKKGEDKVSAIKICKAQIMKGSENFKELSSKEKDDLPDSSFAYISPGGKKDSDGKTTPRSLRHLPYKDADGKPDLAHVRNALARLESTQIPDSAKAGIKKKLEAILNKSKASDKYIGVFPFQFDSGDDSEAGDAAIPDTIHLIPIGQWEHDLYGPIIITASDIREFAQNFNAGIRKGVPITAGHEGALELPAVGWIKQVEVRDDGLWGFVEWNEIGEDALEDKQFKFFSPEFYRDYEDPQNHQMYRNVLVGGALTKAPYFKELEAVVFSEKKLKTKFNNPTMTIAELVAKKVEELTDEEKTFMREHASELTDEQKTAFTSVLEEPKGTEETAEEKAAREQKEADDKKAQEEKEKGDANEAAGLNRDGSAKVDASEKKGKMIQMSEVEVNLLRKQADEGAQAFKELQAAKLTTQVEALTFSETNKAGKFLPKSKDSLRAFMETLNEGQKSKFTALLAELPKTQIFNEIGADAKAVEGTVQAEVEAKVKAKMSENKDMKYSDALKQVLSENKGLSERYNEEVSQPVKA